MPIIVNNMQTNIPVQSAWENTVDQVITKALELHQRVNSEVSVTFVDDQYIHQLNRDYRGVDRPTDVLSFAMDEGEEMPAAPEEVHMLGDVIISLETAQRQAKEYGHTFERELAFLAVHGALHLLGYDHQTEEETNVMRSKEESILTELGINR
ncbi:rRNA maturation RNase YbeY [Peptococcaceae bacterium 1198_IL3148]